MGSLSGFVDDVDFGMCFLCVSEMCEGVFFIMFEVLILIFSLFYGVLCSDGVEGEMLIKLFEGELYVL